MVQAAEAIRYDELPADLDGFLAAQRAAPVEAAGLNVVRPSFPTKPAQAHQKPELSAALDAVLRAGDVIKAAQERAERAETDFRGLEARTVAALDDAEERARAEGRRADEAEARVMAVTERAAERLAEAQALLEAAREEIRVQTERADAEGRLRAVEKAEFERHLSHAQDRVFAAETRALEAQEDLVYLDNYIRESFPA